MFDIDYLHEELKKTVPNTPDNIFPTSDIKEIGTLHLASTAIKFVAADDFIFANGKAIGFVFNDQSSAIGGFVCAMIGAYGAKFHSCW